ncbi:TlpA family protein disulfide reductase [Phaeodactylibacter xiamenensis]|uniref:TlpA family protein disulfide reductase n=1 Tax=Phaeodactylibacter xiamenensis TaxID=1524460 RepID=UPI0024A85391|nr:TlpA disulfide reductase family protein [Phaeodactylibacter xiamenensis]
MMQIRVITFRHYLHLSCLITALLLKLSFHSCQRNDTYNDHLEACMQDVQTSTFEVVGTGETGVVYSGFDVKCLIGAPLSDFEAVDIDGRKVSASRLRGKVTVINFWFKECAPCVAEIPQLNQLVAKYGDEEVNFIALTRDAKAEAQKVLDLKPFHFNQVPDAEAIIKDRLRMILGYPSTIVVDQTGHIVEVFQGAKLKTDPAVPVAAAVDTLLG